MTGLDATIARALAAFPPGAELSYDSLRDAATAAQLGVAIGRKVSRHDPIGLRLWGRMVEAPTGCWEFTGTTGQRGYGKIYYQGRARPTHRVAWELTNGPIPDGLFVCHHCDNPPCCNPSHLFLGTALDNNLDKVRKGRSRNQNADKTHCPRGHEYTPDNTYNSPSRLRHRVCRICRRERNRADYYRARGERAA